MRFSLPPRLHVTGDENEADHQLILDFEDEGFDVTYLPYNNGGKAYREKLANLSSDLELGESYAIVGESIKDNTKISISSITQHNTEK